MSSTSAPQGRTPLEVLAVVQHPVGGIRTYIQYIYTRLPQDKYRFTILTSHTSEPSLVPGDLPSGNFRIVTSRPGDGFAGLIRLVIRSLRSKRYDVIHSHGFTAAVAAALANAYFRLPHILTPHEVLTPEHFAARWAFARRRLLEILLRRVTLVQSVTHDAQTNLLRYFPSLARACRHAVLAHGVDVDRFSPPAEPPSFQWRDASGLPRDLFLFGFLGRMMPEKGFRYLAEAAGILAATDAPPFRVIVLSDGCFIREERARVARDGLATLFVFNGFVRDPAPVLRDLDAVVVPSLREACPLVAIECLVAGCPLVASECIGLREIIHDTPATRVPPADAQALAGAMRSVMSRRAAVKRAALAFAPVARTRFDSRAAAAGLDALFQSVIAGDGGTTEPRDRGKTEGRPRP